MKRYTMEELIEIFKEHARISNEDNRRCVERFREFNPIEPLPDYLARDFNINDALKSMCDEILRLKDGMDRRF